MQSLCFIENVEKSQESISYQEPTVLCAQHIYVFVLSHTNFIHWQYCAWFVCGDIYSFCISQLYLFLWHVVTEDMDIVCVLVWVFFLILKLTFQSFVCLSSGAKIIEEWSFDGKHRILIYWRESQCSKGWFGEDCAN